LTYATSDNASMTSKNMHTFMRNVQRWTQLTKSTHKENYRKLTTD